MDMGDWYACNYPGTITSYTVADVHSQHHFRIQRPQPVGTTASSFWSKRVIGKLPGMGIDWAQTLTTGVTDHRNFEIVLASMAAAGLVWHAGSALFRR